MSEMWRPPLPPCSLVSDEHDDPRIFPTVFTNNMQVKHYSPLICCSNGNHTEHNASSAFCNLPRSKTPLSSFALFISVPSKAAEGVFKQQDTHSANKPH